MLTLKPAIKKQLKPLAKLFIREYKYQFTQGITAFIDDMYENVDSVAYMIYDGSLEIGFCSIGTLYTEEMGKRTDYKVLDYIYIKKFHASKGYASKVYEMTKDQGVIGINLHPASLVDNFIYFNKIGITEIAHNTNENGVDLIYGLFDGVAHPFTSLPYTVQNASYYVPNFETEYQSQFKGILA